MRCSDHRVERLEPHYYVFRSIWNVSAPSEPTFAVLADLVRYPAWWPDFKTVDLLVPNRAQIAVRSVLPITLRFELEREIDDPATGRLSAHATGDIEGSVEWTVHPAATGLTRVEFAQEVLLRHAVAVRFDRAIRPLLEWNHRATMRSGVVGLARNLRIPGSP